MKIIYSFIKIKRGVRPAADISFFLILTGYRFLCANSSDVAAPYRDRGEPTIWSASCACGQRLGYIQSLDEVTLSFGGGVFYLFIIHS